MKNNPVKRGKYFYEHDYQSRNKKNYCCVENVHIYLDPLLRVVPYPIGNNGSFHIPAQSVTEYKTKMLHFTQIFYRNEGMHITFEYV